MTRWPLYRVVLTTTVVTASLVCLTSGSIAPHGTRPASAAISGDWDGDGYPDQILIQRRGAAVSIEPLLSSVRGGAPIVTNAELSTASLSDVDSDGDLDVIATSDTESELWLNDGHGAFTLAKRASARSFSVSGVSTPGGPRYITPFFPSPFLLVTPPNTQPVDNAVWLRPALWSPPVVTPRRSALHPRAPPSQGSRS